MNKTLKLLILSDVFLIGGMGLVSPIFAIFIKENLVGGTIVAAGLATTFFVLVRSALSLIISKVFSAKHRLMLILSGTAIIAIIPFIYLSATDVWHIYLANALYGFGAALAYPSWLNIFTLNIDKKQPGFEWSVYLTAAGLSAAAAAYAGAWFAESFGFKYVFVLGGMVSLIGMMVMLKLAKQKFK